MLDDDDIPVVNDAFRTTKKLCAATLPTPQGKGIQTNGIMFDTDFFLKELLSGNLPAFRLFTSHESPQR